MRPPYDYGQNTMVILGRDEAYVNPERSKGYREAKPAFDLLAVHPAP
jgi:hypothetical protein